MRTSLVVLLSLFVGAAHATTDLSSAIENVRATCGGISAELSDLKVKAGIATGVSAAGAVTGGVALGTGIAKAKVDAKIMWEELLKNAENNNAVLPSLNESEKAEFEKYLEEYDSSVDAKTKISKLNEKSTKLGNIRTGTMAASTATNIASAVLAGTNRVKGDLKQQIDACLESVRVLSDIRMQARIDGSATGEELSNAENIVRACEEWATVDISSINKKAKGAAITSGIGAGMGAAGTATSAIVNSDKKDFDSDKEKKLNMASNVLAGGTAAASLTSAILNGTQIKAIKRAAAVADECEGALN
ncbi:MAG: hypothetical protein IKW67_03910 [Alphaproteobacteria bacterium]|nr:hypothetical protein [Alphaproteobacteria bacterium]